MHFTLLPNKSQATYKEMFTALQSALVNSFGNVGTNKTFLVDFEISAISAIRHVFPESATKGCSFHFRQAVYRHVQLEALAQEYENSESAVRKWLRRIMSLTALLAFAIPHIWTWLRLPPPSEPMHHVCEGAEFQFIHRANVDKR